MPLSDTQVGRTDDDHRDLEVGRKGHLGAAYVQVKTRRKVGPDGYLRVHVEFPTGKPIDHPGFIYAVLLIRPTGIESAWLVASPEFNRLAEQSRTAAGTLQLNFYAHPADPEDRWAQYQFGSSQLGEALLALIAAVPETDLPARRAG